MVAAVTTTAGNVVFAGELTGDFVTLDARTGDVLYRFNTGGPMGGGVVTSRAGGRQYVAVASGSPSNFWVAGNAGAPTIVVFALPLRRGARRGCHVRFVTEVPYGVPHGGSRWFFTVLQRGSGK